MSALCAAPQLDGYDPMAWAAPAYSRNQVDKAGGILVRGHDGSPQYANALVVINNWRASHQYPLNTFQVTLRRKASAVSDNFFVSQRIKRLESIQRKLESGTMQLSQMQDIGGCRAVIETVDDIVALRRLYDRSRFDHSFKNGKDYIREPKDDGTSKTAHYDDLQIEIQIRSQMQHAWATAVEAVGTLQNKPLNGEVATPIGDDFSCL
jgi:Region found in RelA / SpoT proteins